MNRWGQGRADIENLLRANRLTRVAPNRELADGYLLQALRHLEAAQTIRTIDAAGAFQLTYDAARKTLAAILVNQGLRPRGEGAHAVLLVAVTAQLEPPRQHVFREFDWMRRVRNDTEYPDIDRPMASADDVDDALPSVRTMVERASTIIQVMPPF